MDDVIDGDGGLSDVSGEDDLPPTIWGAPEHRLLVRY